MANKVIKIKDLIQDDHNFNRGNERGQELIVKSFKEFGAGRSVLVDKNNRLIGGNKAQLGAIDAGLEDAIIVDTTGDKLVVVRRNDIDLDSEKGRKMALADNATQQANLEWNEDEINAAKDIWNVQPEEWGVHVNGELDMNKFFESRESNGDSQPTEKRIIITVPVGDSYTAEEIEAIIKEDVAGYQGVKVELK